MIVIGKKLLFDRFKPLWINIYNKKIYRIALFYIRGYYDGVIVYELFSLFHYDNMEHLYPTIKFLTIRDTPLLEIVINRGISIYILNRFGLGKKFKRWFIYYRS